MIMLDTYCPGLYLRWSSLIVGISMILMYAINQYLQHDGKFPRQTISEVARHYPEYLIFRIVTISNSVFPGLGWITNYLNLKRIAQKYQILIMKWQICEIILVFGIIGVIALMFSCAFIDTGIQDNQTHLIFAGIFFICTVTAQVLNTVLYVVLSFCYKGLQINPIIVQLKILQVSLIFIQLFVMQNFQLFIKSVPMVAHFVYGRLITNFIQWSITYTILFGYVLMSLDLDQVNFIFKVQDSQIENYQANGSSFSEKKHKHQQNKINHAQNTQY